MALVRITIHLEFAFIAALAVTLGYIPWVGASGANVTADKWPSERMLAEHLLQNYSPDFRPVTDMQTLSNVDVNVYLYRLVEMDDKKQALTAILHYEYQWEDDFLRWDPLKFNNLTEILLSPALVWTPAVRIVNRLSRFEDPEKDVHKLSISYRGGVKLKITERVEFGCLLDMAKYPKDKQNCSVSFIIGDPYSDRNPINITSVQASLAKPPLFMESTEFSVGDFYASRSDKDGWFEVIISISRIRNLIWTTIVMPTSFVTVMMTCANLLPPDSEAKLDVIMNTYLALAIYTTIIGETTPSYTDRHGTPYILRLTFSVMVIGFIYLFIHVLIIRNITMNKQPPKTSVFELFRRLAKVLWISLPSQYSGTSCLRPNGTVTQTLERKQISSASDVCRESAKLILITQIIDWLNHKDIGEDVRMRWYIIGAVVDRIVLLVTYIVMVAINMDSWL